jgi:thioredoxin 1
MAKQSFNELINQSETPVLVDFYADWCGPCKVMAPVLEEVAKSLNGKVKIIKIDTDKNQQVSAQYGIQGIPTLILFKQGKILWRQSGAMPKQQLENSLKPILS